MTIPFVTQKSDFEMGQSPGIGRSQLARISRIQATLRSHQSRELSLHPKNRFLSRERYTVNWDEQWALFAENFHDGMAHIDLTRFGSNSILKLLPGPGFGDLSHPTTALMLSLMKGRIEGETVLDIGSGSGILSLAAVLLGAKEAYGIDIDLDAIDHANKNASLNQLEKKTHFSLDMPKLRAPSVCLMNMIFPEQKGFGPEKLQGHAKLWIVSGILSEQKEEYLKQAQSWGWRLLELRSEDQWIGAVFKTTC